MKKILAVLLALGLILAVGCEGEVKKNITPYSSTVETGTDEPIDDGDTDIDDYTNSNTGDNGGNYNGGKNNGNSNKKTVDAQKSYSVSGGVDQYLSLMEDDDSSETETTVMVEKGTSVPTLKTKWRTMNFVPIESKIEAQATELRNKILNSENTEKYYKWTGKTYYVSPTGNDSNDGLSKKTAVQTMDADVFFMNPPQPGDAILFERGGLWRLTNKIKVKDGVTYGSYGKGEKPTLYGSAHNYADEKFWLASRKANVWKVTVPDVDIGLVVFNHGELVGRKRLNGVTTLEENGDFYYNSLDDTVYLYCDKGNPGKYYKDIEIGLTTTAFGGDKDNVVIDNFKIKYFGQGGIYFGAGTHNTKITNCELGFIGGYKTNYARAGNCLQQWNNADRQYIAYNWMYQPYDTGYTFQGNDTYVPEVDDQGKPLIDEDSYYSNITVEHNLFEYCNYGVETWHSNRSAEHDFPIVPIVNFKMQNNIMRYSGYGWGGMQRPDFTGYHYYVGRRNFKNAKNCLITNNIFDLSSRSMVYWNFGGFNLGDWTITGNTYYQSKNRRNEAVWYGSVKLAYDQSTLESAVSVFDSAPKLVSWVE